MIIMMRALYLIITICFTQFVNIAISQKNDNPGDSVNPFIGTDNAKTISKWESNGGTYPGAALPFGMVQATPEGYRYANPKVEWFSFLNHTSGYPNGSSGNFYIMPYSGDVQDEQLDFGSTISHDNESASPGYYATMLQETGIFTEMTVAPHAGFCRFSFPQSNDAKIVFGDFSTIDMLDQQTITGSCHGFYFYAEMSTPVQTQKHRGNFFLIDFSTLSPKTVLLKIGFSRNSLKMAKKNLLTEIPDWEFEAVRKSAAKAWNTQLNLFQIKGGSQEERKIFYTAVYHSLLDPHLESDVDQQPRYSQLSPWDTFRSKHPLLSLLWPEQQLNMIK